MLNIEVDGIKISYDKYGEGEPIVFLHAANLSKKEWKHQIPYFKNSHRVITMDFPGHGESDLPKEYSIEYFADVIVNVLEKLSIDSFIACGHSLGGMVSQTISIRYPQRVKKLILADSTFGVHPKSQKSLSRRIMRTTIKNLSIPVLAKFQCRNLGKYNYEVKEYTHEEVMKFTSNHNNYNKIWEATSKFYSKPYLKDIKVPTLIMVGKLNNVSHEQGQIFNHLIPNSKLVFIEKAGHMLNMDNYTQFNKVVEEFIQGY
ncbi:alpha/beta hydrolase [Clostridium sp. D2Q-11]|uniref:Alpha/beta hydrolase n=1 Tax=Anaeromonas frigoriresistens TaxID=2683708 RepID=A0A942UX53_9FIRM|nr:alpha/beta hydrolase [Anaeromonas frigoriresistens]MBS4538429.1 alpha/beta hydrolase [Anaeromonas frigoriresistens]